MYDWVRDGQKELEIWALFFRRPRRPTWTLGAFLLQRYAAIYAAWCAFAFLFGGSWINCSYLVGSVYGAQAFFAGSVAFIFAQRTLALYGWPRPLAALLYLGVNALIACFATVASQFRAEKLAVSLNSSWCRITADAGRLPVLGFAASLVFDFVVVVLTMARLYRLRLVQSELGQAVRDSSLLYFCGVFTVNLIVLLVIAISADPTVHATPLGLSFAVTTILLNRMIFGLRKYCKAGNEASRPLGDVLYLVGGPDPTPDAPLDPEAAISAAEKRGGGDRGAEAREILASGNEARFAGGGAAPVFTEGSMKPTKSISISLPPPIALRDRSLGFGGGGAPPTSPSSFIGFGRPAKDIDAIELDAAGRDEEDRAPRAYAHEWHPSSDANTLVYDGRRSSWYPGPRTPRRSRKPSLVKSKDGSVPFGFGDVHLGMDPDEHAGGGGGGKSEFDVPGSPFPPVEEEPASVQQGAVSDDAGRTVATDAAHPTSPQDGDTSDQGRSSARCTATDLSRSSAEELPGISRWQPPDVWRGPPDTNHP